MATQDTFWLLWGSRTTSYYQLSWVPKQNVSGPHAVRILVNHISTKGPLRDWSIMGNMKKYNIRWDSPHRRWEKRSRRGRRTKCIWEDLEGERQWIERKIRQRPDLQFVLVGARGPILILNSLEIGAMFGVDDHIVEIWSFSPGISNKLLSPLGVPLTHGEKEDQNIILAAEKANLPLCHQSHWKTSKVSRR